MKESTFEQQPKKEGENKEDKEKSLKGIFFELRKDIRGYNVSVEVRSEGDPVKSEIDLKKKNIEIKVTPEGIMKGIEIVSDFLQSPEVERWKEWFRMKKEGLDRGKKEPYTEEDTKRSGEIIDELMDRIGKPDTPEKLAEWRKGLEEAKDRKIEEEQLKQKAQQIIREYMSQKTEDEQLRQETQQIIFEYAKKIGRDKFEVALELFSEIRKDSKQEKDLEQKE